MVPVLRWGSGVKTRPPILRRLAALLLGTVLALVLAELVATWALGGAYPYVNLFVADAELGVRLMADAETTVRSPLGRDTDIETNALGFRGPVFSAPAGRPERRVLVLGDSQVMAYGVPEADGFPSRLVARGFDVLAAGIPTWGPPEYVKVADELITRFEPAVVVLVINAANDFHEADHPNTSRTTARDGWAVGLTPGLVLDPPTGFPGRHFLLSRSHLVLAARLLFHGDPHEREVPPALAMAAYAQSPRVVAPPWRSPLGPHLSAIAKTCLMKRCRLITAFLPADVAVDAREWAKYAAFLPDGRPPELGPVLALSHAVRVDEAVLSERAARLRREPPDARAPTWLDLSPALTKPGAFLPDDFHLSAEGHAAVADRLAPALTEALALPRPKTPEELP